MAILVWKACKLFMQLSVRRIISLSLALGHAILLYILYRHFGFNISGEGDKYYTDALELIRGHSHKAFEFQTLYSTYIIYLAVCIKLGVPAKGVIIMTYCISLGAYYVFYRLLKRYGHAGIAILWLAFMLLSPMMQYWNLSLFSESFFIALSLYFLYVLLYPQQRKTPFLTLILSLLLIFTRPSGVFIVIGGFGLWSLKHQLLSRRQVFYMSVSALSFLFIAVFFFMPLHVQGYVADISSGSIYAGFPRYPLRVYPDAHYTLYDCYGNLTEQAGLFGTFGIFAEKCLSFFNLYRGYYSDLHNLFNVSHAVFYILSVWGFVRLRRFGNLTWQGIVTFCAGIVLLNMLLVGLFFNEWSERYTVSVFPFIFVCAAIGLHIIMQRKNAGAV